MVFPLALTPFEEYMLTDDRPAYPMNMIVRLRFQGRFDRTGLDTALAAAVAHHPLLAAVVVRSRRRWVWRPSALHPTVRRPEGTPSRNLPPLDPLDIRLSPGLRVVAVEDGTRTDITIQIHHACCDGMGFLQFIEDLLICYARTQGDIVEPTPPPQVGHLHRRADLGVAGGRRRTVLGLSAGLPGAYGFLLREATAFMPKGHRPVRTPRPSGSSASITCSLDEAETRHLFTAARLRGVSVNDVALSAYLVGLAGGLRRAACDHHRARLRICVPVNMRSPEDRLPAANVMSYVFPERRVQQTRDSQALLTSIHREMQTVKRHRLGLLFMKGLACLRPLPGAIRHMVDRPRCMATGVLTNLGIPFARSSLLGEGGRLTFGEIVLRNMDMLGPLRPLTSTGLAIWTYAQRFCLTLHYDSDALTNTDAAQLVESFLTAVRRYTYGTRAEP